MFKEAVGGWCVCGGEGGRRMQSSSSEEGAVAVKVTMDDENSDGCNTAAENETLVTR